MRGGRGQTGQGADSANTIYGSTPDASSPPPPGDDDEADVFIADSDAVRLLHEDGGGMMSSYALSFDGVDGSGGGGVGVGVGAGRLNQRAGNLFGHPRGGGQRGGREGYGRLHQPT